VTTLLVSATGGHLAELHQLVHRLDGVGDDRRWVTFETEQSRDILDGEDVTFAREVPPRHLGALLANVPLAGRLLRNGGIDQVISNGSGIALAYLPIARALGIPAHYVECAARTEGPSMTGRILERVPGVELYTQYPRWADERWTYAGSVLDTFTVSMREEPKPISSVLVTTGTLFGFRRLVDRLRAILPADVEVVWQTGATDVSDLPIEVHRSLPPRRLEEIAREVDVVVAHAGIGSALLTLRAGKMPVLVPRTADEREHVDDHQNQIAGELAARGLAVARTADALTLADLQHAAAATVSVAAEAPRIRLRSSTNGR
jgi:UDP-N-acetylglucosamine transferase subunit ALG13